MEKKPPVKPSPNPLPGSISPSKPALTSVYLNPERRVGKPRFLSPPPASFSSGVSQGSRPGGEERAAPGGCRRCGAPCGRAAAGAAPGPFAALPGAGGSRTAPCTCKPRTDTLGGGKGIGRTPSSGYFGAPRFARRHPAGGSFGDGGERRGTSAKERGPGGFFTT